MFQQQILSFCTGCLVALAIPKARAITAISLSIIFQKPLAALGIVILNACKIIKTDLS